MWARAGGAWLSLIRGNVYAETCRRLGVNDWVGWLVAERSEVSIRRDVVNDWSGEQRSEVVARS